MADYHIKPTTTEEALEFWIWTNDKDVVNKGFITIENPKNCRKIKTFKRVLDKILLIIIIHDLRQ